MDQAKAARSQAKAQFTRSKRSLSDALNLPEISPSTVERRFNEMKKRWDVVQEAHDAFAAHEEDMGPEDAGKLDEWIDAVAKEFDNMEVASDKMLEQSKADSTARPRDPETTATSSNVSAVKVERMKFSQFNGDIRRYPQFKEEFCKHVATLYKAEQLAFVVKSYLSAMVREEVESCGEDYLGIWKRLDQRFGDKGRLINAIMDEVNSLPSGRNDDHYTLQMIRTVEKAHRDLIRLGAEEEMHNATTIVSIEKKMPIAMKQEWAKEVAGQTLPSSKKFLMLMECLQNWQYRLEYMSDAVRSTPDATSTTLHIRQDQAGAQRSPQREMCWIHRLEGGHPIWTCKAFLEESVAERIRLIEENKACKVCLQTSCPGSARAADCTSMSRFRCRTGGCREAHSRFLHVAKKPVTGSSAHADGDTGTGSTILLAQ